MGQECVARSTNGTPLFECPCPDCGKVRIADRRKIGKRCTACSRASQSTHGLVGHPLYRKLLNMRARCEYPSASGYAYYGGRGISVCREWASDPASFVAWAISHGWAPGLEIDRVDNDGDYEPVNCRFVTHEENSRKRRNARCTAGQAAEARRLLASGKSVADVARSAGIPYMSAWHISKGSAWSSVHA